MKLHQIAGVTLTCGQMADFDLSTSFIPSLNKPSSLLPIARHRQSLLYLVETFPVIIVVGQTGSYIPYCLSCLDPGLESHHGEQNGFVLGLEKQC